MNYIIFDLEWNQCGSESEILTDPVCLPGEIIEIGAVKLDDTFQKVDELRLYIKPKYYSKLHRRIVTLTGIRDRMLAEQGLSFPEAYEKFRAFCGEEYSFMTWSTSDLPILVDNMLLHGIDVSNLPDTYDLQRIFCNEIMRFSRRMSLDDALKILNERGDIAHDALNDSRNTVLVCNHLDLEEYAGEYVSRAFAEQPLKTVFESPKAALEDEGLKRYQCPWCGETVTAGDWLRAEHDEYISMGRCSEEDEILLTLELTRTAPNRFHPRRIFYEMSDDLWEEYSTIEEAEAEK
ncbi:MAG: exonuclease domain-containing protein [Faecousia sp.]